MNNMNFPKNIPENTKYKYQLTFDKEYQKYILFIGSFGGYIMLNQLIKLFKLYNPNLSDSYCRKQVGIMLKDLNYLGFVKEDYINKYKYVCLRTPALAICSGDYTKTKRINKINAFKNSTFTNSLIRIEYYLKTEKVINSSSMTYQLLSITKDIYLAALKNKFLKYDISLLENILKEKDIKTIQKLIINLPPSNILSILWNDIGSIFLKLKLQNQTVEKIPLHYKLYRSHNELKLHYVPIIIILDTYDLKYYTDKLQNLFYQFFNITANDTTNMQSNYKKNSTLGHSEINHIGCAFHIIGSHKDVLTKKVQHIHNSIGGNLHTPFIDNISSCEVDISEYFTSTSNNNKSYTSISKYVATKLTEKL